MNYWITQTLTNGTNREIEKAAYLSKGETHWQAVLESHTRRREALRCMMHSPKPKKKKKKKN